jgi:hypothetical protein
MAEFGEPLFGALRVTGFEPHDRAVQVTWNALSDLSAEERETLTLMLLYRRSASSGLIVQSRSMAPLRSQPPALPARLPREVRRE